MWPISYQIIFYYCAIISVYVYADCDVNIHDVLPIKAPVFLRSGGDLWAPDGPTLKWKAGEETNVVCGGPKNELNKEKTKEAAIQCQQNNKFLVNGKSVDIKNIECQKPNTAGVSISNVKCLNGGKLLDIGFETSSSAGFAKYILVCYNFENAAVVYTYHIIPGNSIDDSASETKRPTFSKLGMPTHVKPNTSYKKESQSLMFAKLLGAKMASKYINATSFLARGHLAPDNDGIFRSWKAATYFYLNVAPQWQSVNGQNWIRVENLSRKKASMLKDNLEVYTGNSGILSLENSKGDLVEMSLEESRMIPVPKYYWKILKYHDEGIAFITLNNPFANNEKELCTDICSKYKWPNKDFELYEKGRTYCCAVKDILKVFKDDVPKEALAKNVMSYQID